MKTYGYARVSTKTQNIERQIKNIYSVCPEALLYQEAFTGTKIDRPEFKKLLKVVKSGDRIIFDSVSRMSRNADEGIALYEELFDKGIELEFIKEPYINTSTYKDTLKKKIDEVGTDFDIVIDALNKYFKILARKQIIIAFQQAQKEVDDLHNRTSEGIKVAQSNGKQIGRITGKTYGTKKEEKNLILIKKYSASFEGKIPDKELIAMLGLSRNTFYKYKKILLEQ